MWLRELVGEFRYPHEQLDILCDSESVVALSKKNVHHERTKHVSIKFHFMRKWIEDCSVKVSNIYTLRNPVDIFTKVLSVKKMTKALWVLEVFWIKEVQRNLLGERRKNNGALSVLSQVNLVENFKKYNCFK